ncbi:SDR family NAD(P)-dependent oxidoreductase [Flavivirga spongiicola]|uniref:SDR family oxidoreductase n=1 Tax=Flavivirga spongiicola TaxID=421621 RepID=A0ABU7XRJ5_9FLAO|nr:SDR family oxidoreductase [Flavivirga sp. MEBiC05379]MDO5978088.1 SDR family oxidoreductase [Flavivirga sp. MEBiC05379]
MKLLNQVFIITGATSGMGKAIAILYAKEGAKLILSGRNIERGNALVNELKPVTNDIIFHAGDVSKPEVNQELVSKAITTYGKLTGIVTNAGVLGLGNITNISIEDWHTTLNTNFNSFFYLCKYAISHIKKEKGIIIANASIAAFKCFPNHAIYCASKAALVTLVKQMALDYGPEIRINAICPGPVDTPLIWDSANAFEDPKKAVDDARKATLLKRLGTPEDIAKTALFLASDDASWITGTALTIDGGIMATS